MALDSQLILFGLDLRKIPQFWQAGWSELLWAPNAAGRRWVDETVTARYSNGLKKYYHAGQEVAPQKTKSQAYVLPEKLVLETCLDLPVSVELDLDSMVALEVRAKSPFPEVETRYGWQFSRTEGDRLKVDIAIVSDKLITQYLWDKSHTLDEAEEVWAMVDKRPVTIQGFGEDARDKRYRHRMKRVIMGLLYSFLMACALIGVMMMFKSWQMERLEETHEEVQQEAAESVALRASLAKHNALVSGINNLIAESYNPYPQINKLSEILADDTWLASMNIKGHEMRLDGRAGNAVSLMESLSNRADFSKVVSPSVIGGGRGQGERFIFDITLEEISLQDLESSLEADSMVEEIADKESINPIESKPSGGME